MAFFGLFPSKHEVDPKLAELLRKRGKKKELQDLQDQVNKSKTRSFYVDELKQTSLKALEKTKGAGTELAADVVRGTAFRLTPEYKMLQKRMNTPKSSAFKNLTQTQIFENHLNEGQITPQEYLDIVTENRTAKQVLGDAGKLALTVTSAGNVTFGKGSLALTGKLAAGSSEAAVALKASRNAQAFMKANTFAGKLGLRALQTGKDFAGGAVFGAADAISQNKSAKEVWTEARNIGAITAATPIGLGLAAKAGIKTASFLNKGILKPVASKIMSTLEKTAQPSYMRNLGKAKNPTEKALARTVTGTSFKQKTAQKVLSFMEGVQKIPRQWVNKFHPMTKIDSALLESGATQRANLEQRFRTTISQADERSAYLIDDLLGASSREERKIADDLGLPTMSGNLKPYRGIQQHVEGRLQILDDMDRIKLGNTTPQFGVLKTAEQKASALKQLEEELQAHIAYSTDAGIEDGIQEAIPLINEYNDNLLRMRLKSGLISNDTYNVLKTTHPNYLPHNVVRESDDAIYKGFFDTGSLNPQQDIKRATGTSKLIDPPLSAMADRTAVAMRNVEKNNTVRALVEAQEETGIVQGMRKLKDGETIGETPTLNVYRNGIKETWVVPEDVAVAVKNLDSDRVSSLMRFATAPVRWLKAGATRLNLSFSIPNKLRDEQTAMITAKAMIDSISEKMGRTPEALGYNKAELDAIMKLSGGSQASILHEGKPSQVLSSLKKFQQSNVKTISEKLNPVKVIETINDVFENSTRREVLTKALAAGLTKEEAAFVARNATIDFTKMGTAMKQLNQVIPFLNARVQGTINLGKAFTMNPEHFMRMQMWSSFYPTMALHQWNRQYETYKNVPQYVKNNYHIIMIGEEDGTDVDGNDAKIAKYVTIRKGEGQALVSNPLQWFLDKADGADFRSTEQMLTDTIGSLSPITVGTFGSSNSLLSMVSQLGPAASITVGLATNVDPYTGNSIIPESKRKASDKTLQTKTNTPKVLVDMAKWIQGMTNNKINMSPAQLDFVQSQFGGMPDDVLLTTNLMKEFATTKEITPDSLTDSQVGLLSQIPIVKRFVREAGSYYGPAMDQERSIKEQILGETENTRLMNRERADALLKEYEALESKSEKRAFLKENIKSGIIDKAIYDQMKSLKSYQETVGVLTKTDSVELRARYIMQKLGTIDSQESRSEYLRTLQENGILTKDVAKLIRRLQLTP